MITAVIIAGGKSRRMGGETKANLRLNEDSIIERIVERISNQCDRLIINTNTPEKFQHLNLESIPDNMTGSLGPLAGILAAMEYVSEGLVCTLPCDTPLIPLDMVGRMAESMQRSDAKVCSIKTGDHLHPIFMLADPSLATNLRGYINDGGRKVQHWLQSQPHCFVDYPAASNEFTNINTPDEYDVVKQMISHE